MALGKNCRSRVNRGGLKASSVDLTGKKLHVVRTRKRVISNCIETMSESSSLETPLKKQCCTKLNTKESLFEALPQEILVKILCGVEHNDLKQLIHVSTKFRDAALIAKEVHFAFSTPSSKTRALRLSSDLEESSKFDIDEAPNAPRQQRASYRSRISDKKLAGISIALFRSTEEEQTWSRRNGLLFETLV